MRTMDPKWLKDAEPWEAVAWIGLVLFLVLLVVSVGVSRRGGPGLFFSWHGWSHRLAGGLQLSWLCLGAGMLATTAAVKRDTKSSQLYCLGYDIVLGVLGITATLTAAKDFPHKLVANPKGQSGTLDRTAIVTQSEMIEHGFYQFLNLWQALYLHAMHYLFGRDGDDDGGGGGETHTLIPLNALLQLLGLWIVTSPWLCRHLLPVHSFSHNWKVYHKAVGCSSKGDSNIEIILYRIKKAQYLFYKHVILHGINIVVATLLFSPSSSHNTTKTIMVLPYSFSWRVFWLLLNTSYVMEFFLQSLVKRRVITQSLMLFFQRWLMITASLGALVVLCELTMRIGSDYWYGALPIISSLSTLLNVTHRHHDVVNTLIIAVGVLILSGRLIMY